MTDFSCLDCPQNFSCVEQAVLHVNSHKHLFRKKSCFAPGCKKTVLQLSKHIRKSHSYLCKYRCDLCNRSRAVFVRKFDLNRHTEQVHSPRVVTRNYKPQIPHLSGAFFVPSCYVNQPAMHLHSQGEETRNLEPNVSFPAATSVKDTLGRSTAEVSVDFDSPVNVKNLNEFIGKELQPTEAFNREIKEIVKKLCDFLQEHMSPNQIVKGGSMGKGTAIKGKSDIDLVLVLNDVEDAKDLKEKLREIKDKIKEKLTSESKNFTIEHNLMRETPFAVQFTVVSPYGNIDVDLLPTFRFQDIQHLYEKMKNDTPVIRYYNASLVEHQVRFVQKYPPNVKNLIRLVKYWKQKKVVATSSKPIPNSHAMELITIHLWEKEKEKGLDGTFNTLKAFHGVMKALKYYKSLRAVWQDNYLKQEIPFDIRQESPLLMDPANPMNNIGSSFSWKEIQDAAKNVLEGPMMRGVDSYTWE